MAELSEVEKLKAARREANAAKRAAAGDDDETSSSADVVAENSAPPPPAVDNSPLTKISQAEAKLDALLTEIPNVTALISSATNTEALDAAAKKQAAVSAGLGQLTAMMDGIDIGEIEDDEARTAARVRRKAINKRCALASSGDVEVDGDLAAADATLKKALLNARSALK